VVPVSNRPLRTVQSEPRFEPFPVGMHAQAGDRWNLPPRSSLVCSGKPDPYISRIEPNYALGYFKGLNESSAFAVPRLARRRGETVFDAAAKLDPAMASLLEDVRAYAPNFAEAEGSPKAFACFVRSNRYRQCGPEAIRVLALDAVRPLRRMSRE
jgi:hypothetical protein